MLVAALIHLALGFTVEFSVDEAHYALYAKHLAWSYFDHPPLVGWIQWPLVVNDFSEGVIRFIPEILWLISCALVYYITNDLILYLQSNTRNSHAQQLPSKQIASVAAVIAIVLAPLPHVLAIGLLPDSLLTPLVLTVMWLAICWLQQAQQFYVWQWIMLGVVLGLAGLSKYTAIFSALALALVFLLSPRKNWLNQSGFWVACLIALVAISPIIFWNWAHEWISFQYQINHGGGGAWSWMGIARFFGIQFLAYGVLLPIGGIVFLRHFLSFAKPQLLALLGFFFLPFTLFAILSAGGGLPHWTSPAWFCLAPFAGIGLAALWQKSYRWLLSL
ncbi:MAG: glycosyl transferase, partial [Betaproteobacteria bacterium]|nr:glycosyl transferase [Betaproteobacteria bacterium]